MSTGVAVGDVVADRRPSPRRHARPAGSTDDDLRGLMAQRKVMPTEGADQLARTSRLQAIIVTIQRCMMVTMTQRKQPDERRAPEPRTPAPGTLAVVQEFINSSGLLQGSDEFAADALSATWQPEINGSQGSLSERDRQRLVAAREGLRDLLETHTGEDVDPAMVVRLEKLLRRPRLRIALSPAGASLAVDGEGVDRFLGRISTAIVEATMLGTWKRLKVCRRDACRWVYYDYSKNGCSRWCSMRVCGSHEKARAYRARHGRSVPRIPVGVD